MKLDEIIEYIEELLEDNLLPKSLRLRLRTIISILKNNSDFSLRINKSVDELNILSEDPNLPAFLRTQIWHLTSLLESAEE